MEKALLIERSIVELDVVAPHAPEAGQDLREGGHDEVLAVPKSRVNALISSIRSISVNLRLGSSSPLPIPSPSANWPYGLLKSSCCLQFDFLYWVWLESSICALSSHIISRRSPIPFVPYIMQQFLSTLHLGGLNPVPDLEFRCITGGNTLIPPSVPSLDHPCRDRSGKWALWCTWEALIQCLTLNSGVF